MNKRKIYNGILRRINKTLSIISTKITYLKVWLLEIEIGRGNKFFGVPYIKIEGAAKITIGNNCTFRSKETSHPSGLNHRVMLSCKPTIYDMEPELKIGDCCGFSGTTIACFCKIIIGNNVRVGGNCVIRDGDNHFSDPRATQPNPIIIEDNVWIGANCVIKKGVHIGVNSLIGMNSVVTKDVPANCVAVGVPAKVIKTI